MEAEDDVVTLGDVLYHLNMNEIRASEGLKTRIRTRLKGIEEFAKSAKVLFGPDSKTGLKPPQEIREHDDDSTMNEKIQDTLNYYYRSVCSGGRWKVAMQDHLIFSLRREMKLEDKPRTPEVELIDRLVSLEALLVRRKNRNLHPQSSNACHGIKGGNGVKPDEVVVKTEYEISNDPPMEKKKRGRPRKTGSEAKTGINPKIACTDAAPSADVADVRRTRGRPRKTVAETQLNAGIKTESPKEKKKRGRPRKTSETAKKPKISVTELNNPTENASKLLNPCYEPIRRKRGRPRKNSNETDKKTSVTNNPPDANVVMNPCYPEPIRRKRGRPRKNEVRIKQEFPNEPDKKRAQPLTNIHDDLFESGLNSKKVMIIYDPTSGNVYYRTLLFVRLNDTRCFQCSTCSELIPFSKLQHDKFHAHYLISHSDCFQCKYCVSEERLRSVQELEHHMAYVHGICPPPEIKVGRRAPKKNFCHTKPPNPSKPSKCASVCPICGMPASYSTQSLEYEQHYYSHMNAEEKEEALRKKAVLPPVKRGRPRKRLEEEQASSNEEKAPVNSQLDIKIKTEIRVEKLFCTLCKVYFHSEKSLRNHLRFQHNACKYPGCDNSFVTSQQLHSHIELDHIVADGTYEYYCEHCGMVFRTSGQERRHAIQVKCIDAKHAVSDMLSKLSNANY